MMEAFEPRNDVERQLLAAQSGEIPGESFMAELLQAQLFMPVRDEYGISNFQASDKAVPLTVEDEEGTPTLVLFTSPERAKEFLTGYPGYEGGLLAEFTWILERVGSGYGIVLNPGWPVGLEMAPEMVDQLAGR
jgi:hypothetical protein